MWKADFSETKIQMIDKENLNPKETIYFEEPFYWKTAHNLVPKK